MTDDLVKMCRRLSNYAHAQLSAADLERIADRIEELEANLRNTALDYLAAQGQASENFQMYVDANEARIDAETSLAKVVEALEHLEKQSSATSARGAVTGPHWMKLSIAILTARAALAELNGEK